MSYSSKAEDKRRMREKTKTMRKRAFRGYFWDAEKNCYVKISFSDWAGLRAGKDASRKRGRSRLKEVFYQTTPGFFRKIVDYWEWL